MSKSVADALWSMLAGARVKRGYGIVGDALNPVIDALRRNGGVPPAQPLDLPAVPVLNDGQHLLRGRDVEALDAPLRRRRLDAEALRQPPLDFVRPARLQGLAAAHDRPADERCRS
jgi:hypothetical protein